ncbi:MAG: Arc family DNA binding domain-containing protein [Clostridia bacterium]|nr:Arc family DNA binding domain-containing protein [Clostridia bacterium]
MAEKKTILLRLSPRIWEEINKWAEEEFRSVNGQIEYLLHEAVAKRKKSSSKKDEVEEIPDEEGENV